MTNATVLADAQYVRCKNSMTGKHKWREPIGKNTGKPDCCIYCSRLEVDLRIQEPEIDVDTYDARGSTSR